MIYATSTTQTFTLHVQIAVSRTRSIRQVARTGIKFTLKARFKEAELTMTKQITN